MSRDWNIPAILHSIVKEAFPTPTDITMETKGSVLRITQRYKNRLYILGSLSKNGEAIRLTRRGERVLAYRWLSEQAKQQTLGTLKLEAELDAEK